MPAPPRSRRHQTLAPRAAALLPSRHLLAPIRRHFRCLDDGSFPSTAGRGPFDEPLDEVHATPIVVEADHETVIERPRDRAARFRVVTDTAGRHRHGSIDGDRAIARIVDT